MSPSARNLEEEIRAIKRIYRNFEQHKMPVRNTKDLRAALRKLPIASAGPVSADVYSQARDTLLYDKYTRYQGEGFIFKDEFYLATNPETGGVSSGELRRHEDKEAFYRLRAQANTEKYLSLMSARVMSSDKTSPRTVPTSRTVIEGPPRTDEIADRGYNRFAHVLQFDGSGIRKAEVVNG